jgi:fructokinase
MTLAALEAGGTKFRAAIFDTPDSEPIDQIRIPTTNPDETIRACLEFYSKHTGIEALGIASFGPIVVDRTSDQYGAIGSTPKPYWSGAALLGRLQDGLGVRADIQTDVEGAAVAEAKLGAGRGHSRVGYVTVGTGIGAALAIDGVPYRGRDHTEMGHVPVSRVAGDDFAGGCPFHRDCLEGMASGPAIGQRWNADPATLDADDAVWELEAQYLAQLVRIYYYSLSPDVVLFGGGVGTRPKMAARIQAATVASLAGYPAPGAGQGLVGTAGLGEDAGLHGAALLAQSLL